MKRILEKKSAEIWFWSCDYLTDSNALSNEDKGVVVHAPVEYNNNTIIIREIQTLTSSVVQCLLTVFHTLPLPHLLIKSDGCILLTNVACTCTSMWTFFPHLLLPHSPTTAISKSDGINTLQRNTSLLLKSTGVQNRWTLTCGHPRRIWMDADLLRKRKSKGINPTFYPHQKKDKCFMSVMVRWQGLFGIILISDRLLWHCFKCNCSRC